MASYQARKRDPLLDSNTQAVIEKRSKELLGIGLIMAGLMFAAMVFSYTAEDPSWISATDAPVQNWMGRLGAMTASTLMMIVGKGIWVVPLALVVWGVRFVLHAGIDRALGRVIFVPIGVAAASLYAATLTPGLYWPPNFGLGGLFGDTVLAVALELLPFSATFTVKSVSLLTGILMITILAYALGFVKSEIKAGVRIALIGCVMLYALILRVVGRGAAAAAPVCWLLERLDQ